MKIQCQKCGNEVEIQDNQQRGFCSYCGEELELTEVQQNTQNNREKRKKALIAIIVVVVLVAGIAIGVIWGIQCFRKDNREKRQDYPKILSAIELGDRLSVGGVHFVYIAEEGTVKAIQIGEGVDYGQCDVEDWMDIVAVSAGSCYTVGLKKNGTVVATQVKNTPDYGQSDVENWKDIVDIEAGEYQTFGVKKDGTVVMTELPEGAKENRLYNWGQDAVEEWSNIVDIELSGSEFIVGIRSNGTVICAGNSTWSEEYEEILDWKNIVKVEVGYSGFGPCIYGLQEDGTVLASCSDNFFSDFEDFDGILDICFFQSLMGGLCLKKDGSLAYATNQKEGIPILEMSGLENFNDLIAIQSGSAGTIGIKKDGSIEFYCGFLPSTQMPDGVGTTIDYQTYLDNIIVEIEDTVKVKVTK